MHVPTFLKQADVKLPELRPGETRYVVADNGVFRERRGPGFTTSTLAADVGRIANPSYRSELALAEHGQYCRLACG